MTDKPQAEPAPAARQDPLDNLAVDGRSTLWPPHIVGYESELGGLFHSEQAASCYGKFGIVRALVRLQDIPAPSDRELILEAALRKLRAQLLVHGDNYTSQIDAALDAPPFPLRRHGLQGSPLRTDASNAQQEKT